MLSRLYKRSDRKTTVYHGYGFNLKIRPGVFHPRYFLSTGNLIRFLKPMQLKGIRLLELGAGSGLVSFYASAHGAVVTSTDINPEALEGLRQNAVANHVQITVLESDLFDKVDPNQFDLILINPPYYPKDPTNYSEAAFFCGEDFTYFRRLFSQLHTLSVHPETAIFMILSEDCDVPLIRKLAHENGWKLKESFTIVRWFERNTIYAVTR